MTKHLPFEFVTSRCVNIFSDHTSTKCRERLALTNYISLSHRGAFLFTDQIDPEGTQDKDAYLLMGGIFEESKKYESYIGGSMQADVAVYYSLNSKMDINEIGNIADDSWEGVSRNPHYNAVIGASRKLKDNHVPYTVIGEDNFNDLSKYQILVLPEVSMLTEEEASAVRRFVEIGGSLYSSGCTGTLLLADLFGFEYIGKTDIDITYMAPTAAGIGIMPGISKQYPLTINGVQQRVRAYEKDSVMATMTMPYFHPDDIERFATIHSNPPGEATQYPSLILRSYGKGKVSWAAAPIEVSDRKIHERIFMSIIRKLKSRPFIFEADAPPVVEVILFHQQDHKRFILNVINEQEKLPPVSVCNCKIRINTYGKDVYDICRLPDGSQISYEKKGRYTELYIPELYLFEMISIKYK
jgi:hypothetical protein